MASSTVIAPRTPAVSRRGRHGVLVALAAMAATLGLILRAYVLARGDFYWDDLRLMGRAGTENPFAPGYLTTDFDGHLMPAAFALVAAVAALAPFHWPVVAAIVFVAQLLVFAALWRMLRVIGGVRPGSVAIFAMFCLTPLTLPTFAWWSAAMNSLPLQAALAWVVADAVVLTRRHGPSGVAARGPSARAIALRSAAITAVALGFFEKSALILPVAFFVAVGCERVRQQRTCPDAPTRVVRTVATRGRVLWLWLAAVTAGWALVFAVIARPTSGRHSLIQTVDLVWRGLDHALVPALIGGPWTWDRWTSTPPFAAPSAWLIAAGWVALVVAAVVSLRARRGVGSVLAAAAVYTVLAQGLVSWYRSSPDTAVELAQTMRYLPDTAVVFAAVAALVVAAPARLRPGPVAQRTARLSRRRVCGVAAATVAVCVSSTVSTVTFAQRWADDPTGSYLRTAAVSLASLSSPTSASGGRMLATKVPLEVLLPVAYPDNLTSHVFAALRDRPQFSDWADRLVVLDPAGRAAPGAVSRVRSFSAGSGACDRPEIEGPTTIGLDGPVIRWPWVVQIAYCAPTAGVIDVRIGDSAPVRAPVSAGLHGLYVSATGTGDTISITPRTPGLALHVSDGHVGELYAPSLLR